MARQRLQVLLLADRSSSLQTFAGNYLPNIRLRNSELFGNFRGCHASFEGSAAFTLPRFRETAAASTVRWLGVFSGTGDFMPRRNRSATTASNSCSSS